MDDHTLSLPTLPSDQEVIQKAKATPLLHTEPALKRMDYDTPLFCTLCESFIEDTPQTLHHLSKHIAEQDFEQALLAAHSLKGSAAVFGAVRLVAIACDIEQMLQMKKAPSDHLNAQLLCIWQDTKQALSSFLHF